MPRKTVYPDWVNKQCPPGHTAKRVGDKYYLYETTSIKVEGKKNPQPQSKYAGVITPEGIRWSSRRIVDTDDHPEWYEYGFTRCFYDMCRSFLVKEFRSEELGEAVALNVIKQLSPKSYVIKDKTLPSPEELHVCICNQIRKIEEKNRIRFDDFAALKDIHILELNGRKIITAVNDEQKKMLDQLGVDVYA